MGDLDLSSIRLDELANAMVQAVESTSSSSSSSTAQLLRSARSLHQLRCALMEEDEEFILNSDLLNPTHIANVVPKEARAEIQYFKRFQLKHEYPEPDDRFTIIGATMHVPPGAAPARSQIHICKKHWPNKKVPSKCLRCKATKAMVQPKLPCML